MFEKHKRTELKLRPKKYHSSQMALITVYMPWRYLEALDKLIQRRLYPNRAEAIRMFTKDGIDFHKEK